MDLSMETWISELEVDDYIIDQCTNYSSEFDEYVQLVNTPEDNFQASSENQSCVLTSATKCTNNSSHTATVTAKYGSSSVDICRTSFERPQRKLKMNNIPKANISTAQKNDVEYCSMTWNWLYQGFGKENSRDLDSYPDEIVQDFEGE